jgi:xanthine dehydrogenase accessory factor
VVVCELADPLAVRRTVSLATAVIEGRTQIEGMIGRLAVDPGSAVSIARSGEVGVLVSPVLPDIYPDVVVDARLAKRNIDSTLDDASLVIGIGPGFAPGTDCHAVVESLRGHRLGRVLWDRPAAPDTRIPGLVGESGAERVIRAPDSGRVSWQVAIGETVESGQGLGSVGDEVLLAPFAGVVRGLIRDGHEARRGLKIGDVDPRAELVDCWEISDKALAIGGGVVEAVLSWSRQPA